ncbi:hypothetical protein Smp_079280 [Schistosoma mansoni]|uniref:hypothetical protein n=1 Tax=Schistosoma mansoni TaxID=6183 RepID=UPI00022DC8EC|nr:hypothetical protein Smp_079280 [Schistosoma mansoni]|eukprot:XP_018647777.1 hypothetical protein Smp_079280 [Schistosoma mansoni]
MVKGAIALLHKRIHKATWISPDHITGNQIDHIRITKQSRRSMEDVGNRKRADIASDHHLVVAKIKVKVKNHCTTVETTSQRFNIAFLQDTDKLDETKIALDYRFQALQDLLKEDH